MHDDLTVLCVFPRNTVCDIEDQASMFLRRMLWDTFAKWVLDYYNALEVLDAQEELVELLCLDSFGGGVDPEVTEIIMTLLTKTQPLLDAIRRRVRAQGKGVVAVHPWTEYVNRTPTPYLILRTRPLTILLEDGLVD